MIILLKNSEHLANEDLLKISKHLANHDFIKNFLCGQNLLLMIIFGENFESLTYYNFIKKS